MHTIRYCCTYVFVESNCQPDQSWRKKEKFVLKAGIEIDQETELHCSSIEQQIMMVHMVFKNLYQECF